MEEVVLESMLWTYWYESHIEHGTKQVREFGPNFDIEGKKCGEVKVGLGTGKNFRISKLYFSEDYDHE